MAKVGSSQFSKSARESVFASIIDAEITENKNVLDIVDFLESPLGPPVTLYPVQRVIAKAIYGVPMDKKPIKVPVYDKHKEKLLYQMTEAEFVNYLAAEGRINVKDWRDLPQRGFNEAVILAGRRGGKALALDTPIRTPSGWTTMGAIQPGDYVFGQSGQPTLVIATSPVAYDRPCYRVSFSDGSEVVADEDHEWATWDQKRGKTFTYENPRTKDFPSNWPTWTSVGPGYAKYSREERKQIAVWKAGGLSAKAIGERLGRSAGAIQQQWNHPVPSPTIKVTHTTREIRESLRHQRGGYNHSIPASRALVLPSVCVLPMDPYVLGYLLGDGDTTGSGRVACHPDDREWLMQKFEAAGHPCTPCSDSGHFYAKGIRSPWESMDLHKGKHVPPAYFQAPLEQRLALVQGMVDSDGGVDSHGSYRFHNTNFDLAAGFRDMVTSLGAIPSTHRRAGRERKGVVGRESWDVIVSTDLPLSLLPRKAGKARKTWGFEQKARRIVAVTPIPSVPVKCICVDAPDSLYLAGRSLIPTHNSQLVSALACYKLYRLLSIRNPQEYYGLVDGSVVDFTFLAQDEDGAQRLYTKMRQDVNQSSFFSPYIKGGSGTSRMQFVTEADRGKRDVLPSINVESHPCTTRSARGPSAIFLAFDEFAHFRSATGSSSDEVYEAASPAVANFKNPNDGTLDSLIVSITSPWTRVGKLWSLWQDAHTYGVDSGVFAIRVATTEMNPGVPKEILTKAFRTSPLTWQAEYGGEFLDSSESFVSNADLLACVDSGRKNVDRFHPRLIGKYYFWGLDLGFKKDASALAVCHWEYNAEGSLILVFDYVDRMMVGEAPYTDVVELPVNDVFRWLQEMQLLMPGCKGATDQHGGSMFTQMARQMGLEFIDLVHFTSGLNSQMYYVLKGFITQRTLRLPDEPKVVAELQNLEATYTGKYTIKVEAPPEKNAHDDMADAIALAAWQANQWLLNEGQRYLGESAISTMMTPEIAGEGTLLPDLDAVSLTQLRLMERHRQMSSGFSSNLEGGMVSPRLFFRRR